jgi:hypothetical protein
MARGMDASDILRLLYPILVVDLMGGLRVFGACCPQKGS